MTLSLASLFTAVAAKQLAPVDLPKRTSHQHELNGSSRLRAFFGEQKTSGELHWHSFAEDAEPLHAAGTFTFYDARLKSAATTKRSEWRMYYSGDFLANASPGDLLVLARTKTDDLHALVLERDSSWLRAARVLFALDEDERQFRIFDSGALDRRNVEFLSTRILGELGFELPSTPDHEEIARRELERARGLPSTMRMANLAWDLAGSDVSDPDEALLRWLHAEERIFRAMEKVLVEKRLESGFRDVDEFLSYSKSVHNRRKSRMGLAFQNHLAELFRLHEISFEAQAFTENRKKPDFLFPSAAAYRDASFPGEHLVMLAAKSSCKERWSQVISEADRIAIKHLCTLETAISEPQTEEMGRQGIVLVLPAALHETYSPRQRERLMTVRAFIDHVRAQLASSPAGSGAIFPSSRNLFTR